MSAQRGGPRSTTTTTTTRLDVTEEKVVRMLKGARAPDDLVLEFQGRDNVDLWKRLREIENRAFEKSGRLAKMKAEAEAEEAAEANPVKAKIIEKLQEKGSKS
ncbi:MAG: hypothetical protein HYV07_23120 [Deltaproteobacteria bacterium]|nr:hypothetical protein [Deltaproteobacteria bacterium]